MNQDLQLAEDIATLLRQFEIDWSDGEITGWEMLSRIKEFVDERYPIESKARWG
jgi:hypothetical protein